MNKEFSIKELINEYEDNYRIYSVTFEILSLCNWRCKHCYVNDYSQKLDYYLIIDALIQFRELGVFEIVFTGGEIFCRDDILDIIREARHLGFKVTLFTNVSLLNEKIIIILQQLNISLISCTLFSLDTLTHDGFTNCKGSLYNVLYNIEIIKQYKIPLEIKMIVTNFNVNEIKKIFDFCQSNGFNFKPEISLYSKWDGNNSPKQYMLEITELSKCISEFDKMATHEFLNSDRDEDYVCRQTRYSVSINPYGNINPCNRLPVNLGNISKSRISEIWESSDDLKVISNLKWKDIIKCNNCKMKKYCVRCTGAALLEDGGILEKSSLACNISVARLIASEQN
jgi:radical SAM protein with 4Fe4S-binding SPASM domain